MKNNIYTGILIFVLLIIVGFLLFTCQKQSIKTDEKVTISKSQLENLIKQASDVKIERYDSIIYKDKIVIRDHNIPVPVVMNDSVKFYTDHIKNSDIDITVFDSIKGTLIHRSFNYVPIVHKETIEVTKTVPQVIYADAPAQLKNKIQVSIIGTYLGTFKAAIGADIGIITKKNIGFHYMLQTDFNIRLHSIRISKTFNF